MNKDAIDQLFREKLDGHQLPPSKEAWSKIKLEINDDGKKPMAMYWKIAAMVVLFFGIGIITLPFLQKTTPTEVVEVPQIEEPIEIVEEIQEPVVAEVQPETTTKVETNFDNNSNTLAQKAAEPIINNKIQSIDNQKVINNNHTEFEDASKENLITDATVLEQSTSKSQMNENTEMENINEISEATDNMTEAIAEVAVDEIVEEAQPLNPSIVITYKAGKEEVQASSETTKKKKSRFKTMLAMASDFKNGEIDIASIRDKKDNLLTFNFSKDKKDKNSK